MKIEVDSKDGKTDQFDINGGNWVIEPNGILHIRDANHTVKMSYADGAWVRVGAPNTSPNEFRIVPKA